MYKLILTVVGISTASCFSYAEIDTKKLCEGLGGTPYEEKDEGKEISFCSISVKGKEYAIGQNRLYGAIESMIEEKFTVVPVRK